MKRYQFIVLSFAFGIFIITLLGGFLGGLFLNILSKVKRSLNKDSVQTREYNTLQIFFSNSLQDPDNLYCERTYFVERDVTATAGKGKGRLGELVYLAIVKLLDGPTEKDKNEGFFTSINAGTKVKKITIENNVASIEFDDILNKGVAGSCRIQAIRSQISETLKQFPEIKDVIISINGRTEDVLQP